MKPIKAIVLTCDKYHALTAHMVFKYEQLWPDHPFHFRVPYQGLPPILPTHRVEFKQTPADIKSTALALLDDLDDEEMIYWCIDDKYPVEINVPRIEKINQWIAKKETSAVSGILFCRCRRMWENEYLTGQTIFDDWKNIYLERNGYEQIWIHQFIRVKVLRHLFKSFPDVIPFAKYMDDLKDQLVKPPSHRVFVSQENLAVFGESTAGGVMTKNCHKSIVENGLLLPAWCSETTDHEIIMGAPLDFDV